MDFIQRIAKLPNTLSSIKAIMYQNKQTNQELMRFQMVKGGHHQSTWGVIQLQPRVVYLDLIRETGIGDRDARLNKSRKHFLFSKS